MLKFEAVRKQRNGTEPLRANVCPTNSVTSLEKGNSVFFGTNSVNPFLNRMFVDLLGMIFGVRVMLGRSIGDGRRTQAEHKSSPASILIGGGKKWIREDSHRSKD